MKEAISDELALIAFLEYDAYHKEMEFYDTVLPKFNVKLQQLGEPELFAEAFGVCKDKNVLILEDLSVKAYKSRPAALGLNVAETQAILKRVATFHAICAILQEEQSDIFQNFKYGELKCSLSLSSHRVEMAFTWKLLHLPSLLKVT